ncbi:MAG: hypothetical protein E6J07_01655, partial [Chloroflexi bacterium]
MSRFRSLRWRLTFLYLGLLAVLLLAGGVAQYFAAREVLFRTNADVLASEYSAVFTAFRKANASRPAAALRALILSQQFTNELRSRNTSAAVFDLNGGQVALTPASLGTEQVPTLTTQAYIDAARSKPQAYYLATGSDGTTNYLVVLNVVRNGTRPLAVAQL